MAPTRRVKAPKGVTGFLFRENKGWVFVTESVIEAETVERITKYWATVSDLPIVVFNGVGLLLDAEGKVVVKEVTFAE